MTLLAYGEKSSGKTCGLGHKGVRHVYEEWNALWLIITVYISAGTEGVWHDLQDLILPAWRDGNRFPDFLNGERHPRAGERMDTGIGLHYTESRLDPNSKDRHIWVHNRHGGWSKILLKSIPHAQQVEDRVKGPAPSMVYVDELTNCGGPQYYTYPALQLSRRRRTYGTMQFTASCNPKGPSHWVYQDIILPAQEGNKDISVHHVPLAENRHRISPDYIRRLDMTLKNPYERRRLMDGEWIDVPAGDAIFKDYFAPEIHVKGDALKDIGLTPLPGFPIIASHDPGPKNYSIHLMQRIPTMDPARPLVWTAFDELNYVGKYKPYRVVVKNLADRLRYWSEKMRWTFVHRHIADEEAFTRKDNKGNIEVLEIQRLAKEFGIAFRMFPAPKGVNSQPQRVTMLIDMLLYETIFISATLEKTLDMLRLLPSKPLKEGEYDEFVGLRPAKCQELHSFDSLTYAPWRYMVLPSRATRTDKEKQYIPFIAGRGSL